MTDDQLFPKPRRRMKQPTKQALRDRIAAQESEIDELRKSAESSEQLRATVIHALCPAPRIRRPWWHRIFRRAA